MHRFFMLFITVVLLCGCAAVNEFTNVELKDGWLFKQKKDSVWNRASVPGCIHLDLMNSNVIPDPFWGDNESKVQWIDKKNWEYKTEFSLSNEILQKQNVDIVFYGLDTYAEVFLNGNKILSAENMFNTWRAACKKFLKEGKNELSVLFKSPFNENLKKWNALPYQLPSVRNNDQCDTMLSMHSRKAGYQWG